MEMAFDAAGRIEGLWLRGNDPAQSGSELDLICPDIQFGEERSRDYAPGTILIGVRASPEEPWVLSRNRALESWVESVSADEIRLVYDMGLLPWIRAEGVYQSDRGQAGCVRWRVHLTNESPHEVEVGELAFPMAFNNLYWASTRDGAGLRDLWTSRCAVHKSIAGAASYLFVTPLDPQGGGLLVHPADDTEWEFYASVPGSLNTGYRWAGIPVVYVHSKAAIEREGWKTWFNSHSSTVLRPGEQRSYTMEFRPAIRDRFDGVAEALVQAGRPAMRVLPSAVSPHDVGVGIEIAGCQPVRFSFDAPVESETDSDEEGGFCFVRSGAPTPVRVSFHDQLGRTSHSHLLLIEPIERLIDRRAEWILRNQVHQEPGSLFHAAILPVELTSGRRAVEVGGLAGSFAAECGLADALFLAEKNTFRARRDEVRALDAAIEQFVRDDLQNPLDDVVGSVLADEQTVASNASKPTAYCLLFNLYRAMAHISRTYGETSQGSDEYLRRAFRTARALYRHCLDRSYRDRGLLLHAGIWELIRELRREGLRAEADELEERAVQRATELLREDYPYAGESLWDTSGFQDLMAAAMALRYADHTERIQRCLFGGRPLAASWWWCGSDFRFWDDSDGYTHPVLSDKGEVCHGYTSVGNSRVFFDQLDEDYGELPDVYLRAAMGGALGAWALVRSDGAASMGFCPDSASRLLGFLPFTGDLGIALYEYLRLAASYVLPSRGQGTFTFGCHYEFSDGVHKVRPWDGVGRRVVLRQFHAEFRTSFGSIRNLWLDGRKRWASLDVSNDSDRDVRAEVEVKGLWGTTLECGGRRVKALGEGFQVTTVLPKGGMVRLDMRVLP
ncbi:MAG: DUF5695 domain-containing protein [Fimbriimonadales bacterium]|nr:DUF5695 domain-containing protein [Fimbriimonadales bacterium]